MTKLALPMMFATLLLLGCSSVVSIDREKIDDPMYEAQPGGGGMGGSTAGSGGAAGAAGAGADEDAGADDDAGATDGT